MEKYESGHENLLSEPEVNPPAVISDEGLEPELNELT
jgi:hypothetical protein